MPDFPPVSIIVPCFNEQTTIGLLLEALRCQSYPSARMEVIIADGMSTDQTRPAIMEFTASHPEIQVRVIDNPRRTIPAGLNQAIAAAGGEMIIRMDAHAVPDPEYVMRCVQDLQADLGDIVGGVWEIRPRGSGWISRAIAAAAAHPLGVGDALYRYATQAQKVDTVPFGAFHKHLLERIPWPAGGSGPYDESLLTNEDYEFNTRVRQSGGKVWLDPAIRSAYYARASLKELIRQYGRYGFWKFRMLRRYPETLRWRQALPPIFVVCLLVLGMLSLFFAAARGCLAFMSLAYLLVMFGAGLCLAIQRKDASLTIGLPVAIAAMHLSWGSAFIWSLVKGIITRR